MAKRAAQGAGNIRKKTVKRNGQEYTYWESRVTIGRDTGTGKQIQKSFTGKTQKEVREKMTAALCDLDKGTYQLPDKITVSKWLDEWLRTFCANKVKPLTFSSYQCIIKKHINPIIGSIELQAIKGSHIQKLYNTMTDNGLSGENG